MANDFVILRVATRLVMRNGSRCVSSPSGFSLVFYELISTLPASPFLLSLGVSKSMMAVVFVAGPLSGLLAQPLVGVLSDSCKSKYGRRRPFIFGGVIVSSISVMLLGWAKEVADWFAEEGGTAVSLKIHFDSVSKLSWI